MNHTIKKIFVLITAAFLLISSAVNAFATGNVTYDANARDFIFSPGSEHSPTDLFASFKNVMPGDSLTQKITVKNDAANEVKVKIYMRSAGVQEDSYDFLSKLDMTVAKSSDNEMGYMFDAAPSETDGLSDWVLLGTLYSGGEVDLDITLNVPIELGNEYQNAVGYVDWQFKVEELPIEDTDPIPPETGDGSSLIIYVVIATVSGALLIIFLVYSRRKQAKKN